jgi:hypothetical protein
MAPRKPQDLLEFFRRSGDASNVVDLPVEKPSGPRVMILRRSQVIVGAACAALGLLLAFLLGLALGGDGSGPAPVDNRVSSGIWTLRVITYDNTERGRQNAKQVMSQLERLDLGDEVGYRRDPANGKVIVILGAWLKRPAGDKRADALKKRVNEIPDINKKLPFESADWYYVENS